jgi:hypothetical protein
MLERALLSKWSKKKLQTPPPEVLKALLPRLVPGKGIGPKGLTRHHLRYYASLPQAWDGCTLPFLPLSPRACEANTEGT